MNSRTAVLIVAALCVAAVLIFLLLQSVGAVPHTTNFFTTSTSTTTSTAATTLPPTVPTTTIINYQGCLSSSLTQSVANGAFSTGTYADWTTNGTGFGSAPQNITYNNKNNDYYSSPWADYLGGTFFASTYAGGIGLTTGNLTSAPFEVTQPYLNFQIISPQNNNLYVELIKNGKPAIKAFYNTFGNSGQNASTFFNASIPIASLLCSNVSIRVVADVLGGHGTQYDDIAVGGFYLGRTPVASPGILIDQAVLNQS